MIESDRPSASPADTSELPTPDDGASGETSERPNPEELASIAAKMGDERKAADIRVLDVSGTSSEIADYFVIMTGFNRRQIQAIAWELDRAMKQRGVKKLGMEGYETAWWVLIDYGSVVVHIFHADARDYYDLDMLQGDATQMDWMSGTLKARRPVGSSSEASSDEADGEADEDAMVPPEDGPVTADYEPVERPESASDDDSDEPDGDDAATGDDESRA